MNRVASSLVPSISQNDRKNEEQSIRRNEHSSATQRLFEVLGADNPLILDSVYLNGLHALRTLEIRNISAYSIIVRLRSNLGGQVAFQLSNENLNLLPAKFAPLTTNTAAAAAAAMGSFDSSSRSSEFNQLFNIVNYVDKVELSPLQTKKIILAFLPENHQREINMKTKFETRNAISGEGNNLTSEGDLVETVRSGMEIYDEDETYKTYNFFDISGQLLFLGDIIYPQEEQLPSMLEVHDQRVDNLAYYEHVIKLQATVCRSILWTDVSETGLNFEDCVVGCTYFKDFTIWNRSEIDLYWQLNITDLSNSAYENCLKFTDYDTGEPLDNRPISSYSHRRIRLSFKPRETSEFSYDLQVENANDANNTEQIAIHVVARSIPREESLILSSGNILDFGNCCAGEWTEQKLVLKNVSEMPLEVLLATENAQVLFELQTGFELSKGNTPTFEFPIMVPSATLLKSNDISSGTAALEDTPASSSNVSRLASEVDSREPSPIIYPSNSTAPVTTNLDIFNESTRLPDDNSTKPSLMDSIDARLEILSLVSNLPEPVSQSDSPQDLSSTGQAFNSAEDLILRPGIEREVKVYYRPVKDDSIPDLKAGQLVRRSFRIILSYKTVGSSFLAEKKIVQCMAKSCSSIVDVAPKYIDFGDTDVGTLKSLPIRISNRSELTARVELRFTSKILNCSHNKLSIAPKQSIDVKLDIYPRKVNPDYRKQITVVNLANRDNDQVVDVRSNNIDKNRVTFHSLFYRILTPTGANLIDFGFMVINSPAVRTFTIDNFSNKKLKLELTSSLSDDIILCTKKDFELSEQSMIHTNPALEIRSRDTGLSKRIHDRARDTLFWKKSEELTQGKHSEIKDVLPITSTIVTPVPLEVPHWLNHTYFEKRSPNVSHPTSVSAERLLKIAYLDLAVPITADLRPLSRRRFFRSNGISPSFSKSVKPISMSSTAKTDHDGNEHFTASIRPDSALSNYIFTSGKADILNSFHKLRSIESSDQQTSVILKNNEREYISERASVATEHHSLGLSAARKKKSKREDIEDIGQTWNFLDALPPTLELNTMNAPQSLSKADIEDKFVHQRIKLRRDLDNVIKNLTNAPILIVEVPAHTEEEIIVIFKPNGHSRPYIQGLPKKQDAHISLRLLDFDRNIEQTQFDTLLGLDQKQIPVRELLLRCFLCRSVFDLGQKHINFGTFEKNERRTKSIVLQNRSEAPLLYVINKSGLIASAGISFLGSGGCGVIRGFGKKEVEFMFEPSLPGPFQERLLIENVQDRENSQEVLVKASIRKPSSFFIKSLEIDFGPCFIDQFCSRVQKIIITNSNKQTRIFEIRYEMEEMQFCGCTGIVEFALDPDDGIADLSNEAEEEKENLEQKLKIATRKGQKDKVLKYKKKLEKFKQADKLNNPVWMTTSTSEPTEDPVDEQEILDNSNAGDIDDLNEDNLIVGTNEDGSKSRVPGSITKPPTIASQGVPEKESMLPLAQKFRKNHNSIVFSIDGRTTTAVSVHFKPISKVNENAKEDIRRPIFPSEELVSGCFFVHEHKNTDIQKRVTFMATVCYDFSRFPEIPLEDSNFGDGQIETVYPPFLPNLKSTEASRASYRTTLGTASWISKTLPSIEPLHVEVADLDVGRVPLMHSTGFYMQLTNRSNDHIDFEFDIPEFEVAFFTMPFLQGALEPKETRRIDFRIQPSEIGRQTHTLKIMNRNTNAIIFYSVHCLAHRAQYLCFPSLGNDTQSELDLGFCYVTSDSKYSQVTPLLVENITDEDLYISCQSNLASQMSIFLDEKGERGQVEQTLLKHKGIMTVWVALQPSLWSDIIEGARKELGSFSFANLDASEDDCRTLVGGIKFSISVKSADCMNKQNPERIDDDLIFMTSQTVKFTSLIGRACLKVSPTIINLGQADIPGETFYGYFDLSNLSGRLPLEYLVECPNGDLHLDRSRGILEGCKADDFEEPSSSKETNTRVSFWFIPSTYGLFRSWITVTNLNNSLQNFEVEVLLFVDEGLIRWSPFSLSEDNNGQYDDKIVDNLSFESDHRETRRLPLISWDEAYVIYTPSTELTSPSSSTESQNISIQPAFCLYNGNDTFGKPLNYEKCLRIEYVNSDEALYLSLWSDMNLSASWSDLTVPEDQYTQSNKPFTVDSRGGLNQSFSKVGPSLLLERNISNRIYLTCPSPSKIDNFRDIESGKKVQSHGTLGLLNERTGQLMKMWEISAQFCLSIGKLDQSFIDLGKLGHSNKWTDVPFHFSLRNLSNIYLHCKVECPDAVQIMNFNSPNFPGAHSAKGLIVVEPHNEYIINAVFKPHLITDDTPGPISLPIKLVNVFNPFNLLDLRIDLEFTTLELRFDQLTNRELILPPLHFPSRSSSIFCDSSFVVNNVTNLEVRFEVSIHNISTDIAEIIRLETFSRFSNSSLKGGILLGPKAKMEIRVRAHLIEGIGVPPDKAFLTDPDGIYFGRLRVITTAVRGEPVEREAEEILIRGVLEEVQNLPLVPVHSTMSTSVTAPPFTTTEDEAARPGLPSIPPPSIHLRGCKRIGEQSTFGGRYELNLGQQDSGTQIIKKLTLENSSSVDIPYRIKVVSASDSTWMNISPIEGILEAVTEGQLYSEPQIITLSFSANNRSVLSAYVIIENVDNPVDTKTLRVTMEVVARPNFRHGQLIHNTRNSAIFDVYVNGVDTSQSCIEMLNLFYGSEYTTRSILIRNRESVPLEFTLMSNLSHNEPSELLFSTSRTTAKLFKSLNVDANGHVRVYIRFRPFPTHDMKDLSEYNSLNQEDTFEEKLIEIYVNCRSVKDYQQTILLKAKCYLPAFKVHYNETEALMGRIQRDHQNEYQIGFTESSRPLVIENTLDDPLDYEIVNDTIYFLVEFPKNVDSRRVPPRGFHEVKIVPDINILKKHADVLSRDKYIQENITIYNKNRPQENYWIALRMSFGHVLNFQMASGHRISYAYNILEGRIVNFLAEIDANIQLLCFSEADEDEAKRKWVDLKFRYYYIVDQLVYYSTVKTGESFFQLATLLFTSLLSHDLFQKHSRSTLKEISSEQNVWPPDLACWVSPLHYYLSFFAYQPQSLGSLRDLHSTLIAT